MCRRYFTMLEILLVIAIIGTMAGIIGMNVTYAVREQHFRSEVELVTNQLRLAQDLTVIFHANVSVVFTLTDNKDGYILELIPEVILPGLWLQEITRKTKLTYIHVINFEGIEKGQNDLKLNFRSGGSEMPYGTLRLSTGIADSPEVRTRYIFFPGYATPLFATASKISTYKDDSEMNQEVTQRIVEVIRAIPTYP